MISERAIAERYGKRVGEVRGHLTFVGVSPTRGDGNRFLGEFRCDCGGRAVYRLGRDLCGEKIHCGCRTDRVGDRRTHGMRYTPEYRIWAGMKVRCLEPNNRDYPNWGGRGITVCDEWVASFESFFAHVGKRPPGMTLDRIDNSRGYEPGNVRWATQKTQAQNTRTSWIVNINGTEYPSLRDAADAFGVSETTIVRWCDGYVDNRQSPSKRFPPRHGCTKALKYAS